uniref:Glutaredoxin domain-containing protein n=1 Tax=Caenorhabditis tropicalis TaxID=1561998 RepID=A0A1I7U834_9PELO
MTGEPSRKSKIDKIIMNNSYVLFFLISDTEEFKRVTIALMKAGINSFVTVPVDENVEIRLGVKEFSGQENFPQFYNNGELQTI